MQKSLIEAPKTTRTAAERTVVIAADRVRSMAIADLAEGLLFRELWLNFAFHDIRQRFRRSMLGPFWITLSTGIMVGALALVFGTIFSKPSADFIPYLTAGLIFWNFLLSTVNEGAVAYVASESYIRSVPMPVSVHFYRMFARNLIVLAHNMVIYVVVMIVFRIPLTLEMLLFIPGLLLFCGNLFWISMVCALLSTRFRDIPQLVTNLMQVVFFVTPIFWSASQIPRRAAFVVLNPIYHMIEIVRAPLLNEYAHLSSWIVTGVMLPVGLAFAALLYRRAYPRIAYWV